MNLLIDYRKHTTCHADMSSRFFQGVRKELTRLFSKQNTRYSLGSPQEKNSRLPAILIGPLRNVLFGFFLGLFVGQVMIMADKEEKIIAVKEAKKYLERLQKTKERKQRELEDRKKRSDSEKGYPRMPPPRV
ncbi:hypothetical protein NPIL_82371 [Nephila pilipes]|uniref:Uncharacterized protein n=1 Tax=Nephila pilipes TaxID=299642 RepID=A0A8X6UVC5_NEPPI|nr:hypothetical protein NPIL_82371 [Nephila pilipes]